MILQRCQFPISNQKSFPNFIGDRLFGATPITWNWLFFSANCELWRSACSMLMKVSLGACTNSQTAKNPGAQLTFSFSFLTSRCNDIIWEERSNLSYHKAKRLLATCTNLPCQNCSSPFWLRPLSASPGNPWAQFRSLEGWRYQPFRQKMPTAETPVKLGVSRLSHASWASLAL